MKNHISKKERALLTIAGAGAAFVSDWFVSALTPTIDRLHISQAFAGIVIVAIAGNAVENVAGIMLAAKGQELGIQGFLQRAARAFLYAAKAVFTQHHPRLGKLSRIFFRALFYLHRAVAKHEWIGE